PLFSPYDPTIPVNGSRLAPPFTPGHPFGIDSQQRDVLARLLWGGRISLLAGIVPTAAATLVSLALGTVAAYAGGVVETVVMRGMDILFAFPSALLAIAIAGTLGPNEQNQMLAIGIVLIPYITRVVHDSVRGVAVLPYVEANRSMGASTRRTLVRHVVPNAFPPVLAQRGARPAPLAELEEVGGGGRNENEGGMGNKGDKWHTMGRGGRGTMYN